MERKIRRREIVKNDYDCVEFFEDLDRCNLGDVNGGLIDVIMSEYSKNMKFRISLFLKENRDQIKKFDGFIQEDRALKSLENVAYAFPDNPIIWITFSRFETVHGEIDIARNIIKRGCELHPENEDLWIEAMVGYRRDHFRDIDHTRSIFNQAIHHVSSSVMFWISAASFEHDTEGKQNILQRAGEYLPHLNSLWEVLLVNGGNRNNYEVVNLLQDAVKDCDTCVELWLTLAKLDLGDEKKSILEKAVKLYPVCLRVWLMYANFAEKENILQVQEIIDRALISFADHDVKIITQQWITNYYDAYQIDESYIAFAAVIKSLAGYGDNENNCFIDKLDSFDSHLNVFRLDYDYCHDLMYSHLLQIYPKKKIVHVRALFHMAYRSHEFCYFLKHRELLSEDSSGFHHMIQTMLKWFSGDIEAAEGLLVKILKETAGSEKFCADFRYFQEIPLLSLSEISAWLMMVMVATNEYLNFIFASRELKRVIRKAWLHGKREYVAKVLERATEVFPSHSNLEFCERKGQVQVEMGQIDQAAQTFREGFEKHTYYNQLWLYLAELEEKRGNLIEARSVLQQARLNDPTWVDLWIDSVYLEVRAKEPSKAISLLNEALKNDISRVEILSLMIIVEDRQTRKSIAAKVLKEFGNNKHILLAIAKMFFSSGKVRRSRKWFNKTVECAPEFGDAWAYFYKLEHIFGNENTKRKVIERCAIAYPQIGREYIRFKKDIANWGLKTTEELLQAITPRFFLMPT